jgi:hypothetical protein
MIVISETKNYRLRYVKHNNRALWSFAIPKLDGFLFLLNFPMPPVFLYRTCVHFIDFISIGPWKTAYVGISGCGSDHLP